MSSATAVQTSAQDREPDMLALAGADVVLHGDFTIEVHGVLTHAATVCVKLVGEEQRSVPVLCLDIRPLSGCKRTMHATQIYSEATRKEAEQMAAKLKRGSHIKFTTGLNGMRITFPHIKHVALIPHPESTSWK